MKLPKIYNPFKAHIVQFANGKFAVRKWKALWVYKETETFRNEEIFWWNSLENAHKFCTVDTFEQAVALRDKVQIKYDPKKVVEVYAS